MYDAIVVGAGLSGIISAWKLSKRGKRILIIEKRKTIGGNVYDRPSYNGILEHVYGPHIFHTNNKDVVDFLSIFTDFVEYEHKVAIRINGEYITMPFNLNSIYEIFPNTLALRLEDKLLDLYKYGSRVPILKLKENDDKDLRYLATFIYENIFLGYTTKQWGGLKPEELDEYVTSRVPIAISRDNRYFSDKYQMQPKYGFSNLCNNILSDMKKVSVMLNTDFRELLKFDDGKVYLDNTRFEGEIIYSACIEDILENDKISLPYRSLRFDRQLLTDIDSYQPFAVVNYSTTQLYTRVTEFKKLTCQKSLNGSVIIKEYSVDYDKDGNDYSSIPYYPIPREDNYKLYKKVYDKVKDIFPQIKLIGRLAEYKYYNMDGVIEKALES